jgi:muramidase (phage lysozyme)
MTPNQKAFLDTIAWSEGTIRIQTSDDGYNVLVGSTPAHPLLFTSYADHPRILNKSLNSTAAGRYQVLERYYDAYKTMLDLPDFSPDSQDTIALRQIFESGACNDIESGNFATAAAKVGHIWASFPSSPYGQHENTFNQLVQAYKGAGGTCSS